MRLRWQWVALVTSNLWYCAPSEQPPHGCADPVAEYRRRIGLANRAEDCAEGLAAFRELAAAGLRAETKLYNSVLSLCALDGASRWDDAFEVYKAAEAAGLVRATLKSAVQNDG